MNAPNRARSKCASRNWPDRPADCPAARPAVTAAVRSVPLCRSVPPNAFQNADLLGQRFSFADMWRQRHGRCAACRESLNAVDVAMVAAREPASIGHLRASRPETRANTGLAGRVAGNAHSTRASGHAYRQRPIRAGHKPIMTKQRSVPPCLSHRCPPLPGALHLAIAQKRVPRQSCMIACLPNHCAKLIFTIIRHVTHPAPRRSGRPARHA